MLQDIVRRSRSIRRFDQSVAISQDTLRGLVDMARLAPSGRNIQPLKYILSTEPEKNAVIFEQLAWAGALPDWPGPAEGERPTGYIIVLADTLISADTGCDHGIVAQTIMLGAAEQGLGGCILGSIKRTVLREALNLPEQYKILLVLALGKPAETVVIDPLAPDGSTQYWRDGQSVHHVPKRALDDIIIPL